MSIEQSSMVAFLSGCEVGDCLFPWGGSWLSHQIERQTGGGPSHVSMVHQINARTPDGIILVESTQISNPKRFIGVVNRSFGEEYGEYSTGKGQMVWAPLSLSTRQAIKMPEWLASAKKHMGDPYSYAQMILEAYNALVSSHHIPILDGIAEDFARGNWHREFCSQLWCILGQDGGILSPYRIPGLTAPLNAFQAKIYAPTAMQILGNPLVLENDLKFNTVAP